MAWGRAGALGGCADCGHWKLFKGNGGSRADDVPRACPMSDTAILHPIEFFIRSCRSFVTESDRRRTLRSSIGVSSLPPAGDHRGHRQIRSQSVDRKSVCGGDVIVLRPQRESMPRFLGYATNSFAASVPEGALRKRVYGRSHLRKRHKTCPLGRSTGSERVAIVSFFDHADRLIRRCVRAKPHSSASSRSRASDYPPGRHPAASTLTWRAQPSRLPGSEMYRNIQ